MLAPRAGGKPRTSCELDLTFRMPLSRWRAKPFNVHPFRSSPRSPDDEMRTSPAARQPHIHPFLLTPSERQQLDRKAGLTKAKRRIGKAHRGLVLPRSSTFCDCLQKFKRNSCNQQRRFKSTRSPKGLCAYWSRALINKPKPAADGNSSKHLGVKFPTRETDSVELVRPKHGRALDPMIIPD
jgi:hypothetical protein